MHLLPASQIQVASQTKGKGFKGCQVEDQKDPPNRFLHRKSSDASLLTWKTFQSGGFGWDGTLVIFHQASAQSKLNKNRVTAPGGESVLVFHFQYETNVKHTADICLFFSVW